jgi:hypothetical protein
MKEKSRYKDLVGCQNAIPVLLSVKRRLLLLAFAGRSLCVDASKQERRPLREGREQAGKHTLEWPAWREAVEGAGSAKVPRAIS